MSHFIRLQTEITDFDMLKQVVTELGFSYDATGREIYASNDGNVWVDAVVGDKDNRLGTAVGFQLKGGRAQIVFDRQKLREHRFPDKLMQRYAYNVVRMKLETDGFRVDEETNQKGEIHLVLRRST